MLIIKYLKCFGLKDSGFFKDLCLSKRIDKIWHIKVCNLTPKQPHNCLKSNILFFFSSKGTYATWDLYLGIHQNWTCHQCSLPPQEWQLVCLCRYQDCQNVRKWFLKIFTDYTNIIYLFIECKLCSNRVLFLFLFISNYQIHVETKITLCASSPLL